MKKKLLSLLLAIAMVISLAACEKKPAMGKDATATEPVVIVHTNDVHGAVEGYAKVAALADQYAAEGAYVLVLDAGDFSQGDTSVSLSEGATAIELMNMAGYDAVALGNHEFDYGFEALKKNMESAQFPVLAANVKYNGELAFDDAAVFTAPGGTKIGVFGLDTPETATKAHPGKIAGVTFASGEEMYQIAQDMATMLREDEGCNYVICVGHLGIDDETATTANRSIDLLNKVTGIDVFIDGHSHSTEEEIVEKTNADRKVGETILTSTGTKLENIGVVTIKDSAITTECVPTEGIEIPADSEIAARAAAIIAEVDAEYGTVFAKTKVELDGVTVSSTYIRSLVEAGEVERAACFLGHPHRMSGTVRHGEGIGRKRLFPTANLVPDAHIIVPKRGVYATRAYLTDGTQRVGVRPTVSDANRVTVETYLVDFDGDLYGQELRLDFCAYLRPEKKFPSARELHDRIAENIREAASLVSLTERDGKTDK